MVQSSRWMSVALEQRTERREARPMQLGASASRSWGTSARRGCRLSAIALSRALRLGSAIVGLLRPGRRDAGLGASKALHPARASSDSSRSASVLWRRGTSRREVVLNLARSVQSVEQEAVSV